MRLVANTVLTLGISHVIAQASCDSRIAKIMTGFLTIDLLQWCVLLSSFSPQSPGVSSFGVLKAQRGNTGFTVREPNLYAPHVYADDLEFIATLVDLPGARNKQSYWELSYQLFLCGKTNITRLWHVLREALLIRRQKSFPGEYYWRKVIKGQGV